MSGEHFCDDCGMQHAYCVCEKTMTKSRKEPTPKERLFNYFIQEHGITLLESQLEDVINIIEPHIEAKYAGVVEALNEIIHANDEDSMYEIAKEALKELD
jgi:hypothetical protein